MWSLLFYYALLNAACIMVLLAISWDPPIWDEDESDLWQGASPPTTEVQEPELQQVSTHRGSTVLYDIDAKAVA